MVEAAIQEAMPFATAISQFWAAYAVYDTIDYNRDGDVEDVEEAYSQAYGALLSAEPQTCSQFTDMFVAVWQDGSTPVESIVQKMVAHAQRLLANERRSVPAASDTVPDLAMTVFDPAAWLRGFAEIGGGYTLRPDGRLNMFVSGCDNERLAGLIAQVASNPDRQLAIEHIIKTRQNGESNL